MRFDWWTVSFQCNSDITAKLDDNTEHNNAFVLKKKWFKILGNFR